jgi:hypothetical protein
MFNDDVNAMREITQMYIANDDSKYYIEEMRSRAVAILDDTGEDALLFIKQWRGLPDKTTQDEMGLDPNNQGMSRADGTYGVGFYPGYFPSIRIKMRFGGVPSTQYDRQLPGLRPLLDNESWTNWEPTLHEGDIILRVSTGQRYEVRQTGYSNYRTVPITQRLTLTVINQSSPLYNINDTDLWDKWRNLDTLEYMRMGFSLMPPTNLDIVDYLLFY